MKRLVAALVAAFFVATPALADKLLLGYINWIVENSEFEYNGEPLPEFKEYPLEVLQIMYYGEVEYNRYSQMENVQLADILALYDDRTIYMREGSDWRSWEHAPTVVHELVHYLQEINGIEEDCIPNLEPPAYEIQMDWMDAHDHPGERPNGLFLALIAMACDHPHEFR